MVQLRQPWKEYLAQKAAKDQVSKNQVVIKSDPASQQDEKVEMCPGSAECGFHEHLLGSTNACAFRSHMACEVVMQGSTGTSG
jgi:hypothetical protein